MENCIFCKIARGEIPVDIIYEDEKCIVIPDKFPATKGQSLVITKKHEPYLMNLDNKIYTHIFEVAKKIAKSIDKSFNTIRTCFVIEGFAVPHVHIRLHPAYKEELETKGKEASREELKDVAEKVRKNLK